MRTKLTFLLFSVVLFCVGCPGPQFPDTNSRATARQVTMGLTVAFDATVNTCVYIVRGLREKDVDKAKAFGKSCYAFVKPLEDVILTAAKAVDEWDSDKNAIGKVSCAAKLFVDSWPKLKALINEFAPPPPEVDDVMAFAKVVADTITPVCGAAK